MVALYFLIVVPTGSNKQNIRRQRQWSRHAATCLLANYQIVAVVPSAGTAANLTGHAKSNEATYIFDFIELYYSSCHFYRCCMVCGGTSASAKVETNTISYIAAASACVSRWSCSADFHGVH